jgi:hypothetical protein
MCGVTGDGLQKNKRKILRARNKALRMTESQFRVSSFAFQKKNQEQEQEQGKSKSKATATPRARQQQHQEHCPSTPLRRSRGDS